MKLRFYWKLLYGVSGSVVVSVVIAWWMDGCISGGLSEGWIERKGEDYWYCGGAHPALAEWWAMYFNWADELPACSQRVVSNGMQFGLELGMSTKCGAMQSNWAGVGSAKSAVEVQSVVDSVGGE
ncbi:unnamed protein product [Calypogeia fissa]